MKVKMCAMMLLSITAAFTNLANAEGSVIVKQGSTGGEALGYVVTFKGTEEAAIRLPGYGSPQTVQLPNGTYSILISTLMDQEVPLKGCSSIDIMDNSFKLTLKYVSRKGAEKRHFTCKLSPL